MSINRNRIVAACMIGAVGVAGAFGAAWELGDTARGGELGLSRRILAASPAPSTTPFPPKTRALIDRIEKIEYFAIGGTGVAGTTSDGETTFRALLQEPRAVEAFDELQRAANPQGRLYALLALKRLAPDRYQAIYPTYASDNAEAQTMSGCMMMPQPIKNIALNINNGAYDIVTLPTLTPASQKIVKRLAQTPYFSLGAVGPPAPPQMMRGWGPISDGERDLRRLLSQPDAVPALETVLRSGNWQGRLYGLVGLRRAASPGTFPTFYQSFPANAAVAHVLMGCLVDDQPAHDVAKEINKGVWDDYLKRMPTANNTNNVR